MHNTGSANELELAAKRDSQSEPVEKRASKLIIGVKEIIEIIGVRVKSAFNSISLLSGFQYGFRPIDK